MFSTSVRQRRTLRRARSQVSDIVAAIADMDASTQHNAALVEESAAAATALRDQADRLAEVVSLFHLDARAAPAPTSARARLGYQAA